MMINELLISQKFNSIVPNDANYADDIRITFDISSKDYSTVYDKKQDLMAILTITMCDREGLINMKTAPQKRTYRAMLLGARDLKKEKVDVHLRTEPDTKMTLQLIEEEVHKLRLKSINTIYRAMNMTSTIRHVSVGFGLKGLTLTPPDSDKTTFDQIVISPYKNFGEIFDFLQKKYGVYMCGIANYFTGSMLYVYAPYDINPKTKLNTIFYQADQGQYAGAPSHHSVVDGNYQIVIDSFSAVHDHTTAAAENHGTSHMFHQSAETIDGIIETDDRGNISYKKATSLAIKLKSNATLDQAAVHNRFVGSTDNMFEVASNLIKHQAVMVNMTWSNAIPFAFTPGQAVTHYSDEDGKIRKRTGIMEMAEYGLRKMFSNSSGVVMVCSAHLRVRLDPDGSLEQTTL